MMKSLLTTILALFFTVSGLFAQSSDFALTDKSSMIITGTSTLHDWEADVQKFQVDVDLDASALEKKEQQNLVQSLLLTVSVESIESGKGGMDKRIYDALKEKKHPEITFELTGTILDTNPQATNGNEASFNLMTSGMLNIAGVANEISVPVSGYIEDENTYKFTGSYEINMKDYNVDPPSAMFGTIKSGEMVTVSFEFYIAKS